LCNAVYCAVMARADDLRDLSRLSIERWNARDFDACYAVFHPSVVYHAPDGGEVRGIDALRARYDAALAWCPDLMITLVLCVADPEAGLVASIQLERRTAINDESVAFEGMTFFRMGSDDRVAGTWENTRSLT
jgi:SnoaL-like domain